MDPEPVEVNETQDTAPGQDIEQFVENEEARLMVDLGEEELAEDDKPGDEEVESIKARLREMEEETEKIRLLQDHLATEMVSNNPNEAVRLSFQEKISADSRSIYVGNVDYSATGEELEQHFHGCGPINRVNILCNKFDGHPKGFAYIEFAEFESVTMAILMDESLFKGRQIKVMPKRTNVPGQSTTDRPPRGFSRGRFPRTSFRGGRGRGFSSHRGNPRLARGFRSRPRFHPY